MQGEHHNGIQNGFRFEIGLLRILACLLVICSHVVCLVIFNIDYEEWDSANLLYICRTACVPLFLTITGILTLNKEITLKKCLHSFLKFIAIYFIFAILYQTIYDISMNGGLTLETLRIAYMYPKGHLWYLIEIAKIYLILPILKAISANEKALKTYLICWVSVSICLPGIVELLTGTVEWTGDFFFKITEWTATSDVFLYSGYLLLGYYLYYIHNESVSERCLIVGFLATICTSFVISKIYFAMNQNLFNNIWNYNSLTALFETYCLVMIFKIEGTRWHISENHEKIIQILSQETFGVYLIHAFFTEKFMGILTRKPFFLMALICVIVIYLISTIIVWLFDIMKKNIEKNMRKFLHNE